MICLEYGRKLVRGLTQDGYARALQGVHIGQVLHGTAKVLGD